VNLASGPKAIPGAEMAYTIQTTNTGQGHSDNNSMVVTDPVPANTSMCVSALCNNPPVAFSCSVTPACGLTYNYAADVTYSNHPGGVGPYDYMTLSPDANGYDAAVTGVRINPKGILPGAAGGNPSFSVFFKVRVK
jgi:uncharacterized repeat protein (TIGR01451 family)